MKFYEPHKPLYKKKQDSGLIDVTVYFIFAVTMLLLSPLIFMMIVRFSNTSETAESSKSITGEENIVKTKVYNCNERSLDLSFMESTEGIKYRLISANVTNSSEGILLCGQVAETEDESTEGLLKMVKCPPDAEAQIYKYFFPNSFLQKVEQNEYVYKDYGDGYIYIAYDKTAHLFDVEKMRISANYTFPQDYEVYQAALSNDKTMLALATDKGLFVRDVKMTYLKELISAIETVGGVKTLPKNPIWSNNDEYIYYTLYADDYVKSAGRTPLSLGGNEHFTALENTNFYVLNDGTIFYYNSTNYRTGFENLFRCGYFTAADKKMNDMIKSQIYYFDIRISSDGTHLAALSYNGKMKKISVIDVKTKKNIYSALYDDIYDFEFSPNEKNLIVYGMRKGEEDLRVIEINWSEE